MQECVLVALLTKLGTIVKITAKLFSRDEKHLAVGSESYLQGYLET